VSLKTPPYFRVSNRVVCVDASPARLAPHMKPLVTGRIYVIRAIDQAPRWKQPGWGVHLEGIWIWHPSAASGQWAFNPNRFRLVEERPTDIGPLLKLLEPERD
jgi:hypothetical protein